MTAEQRLKDLGLVLPGKINTKRAIVPCLEDAGLLYVSGHGPEDHDGNLLYRGRVGAEVSVEDGYAAARATAIQLLRSVRAHLGSLDRVERVIKVLGLVNSADDFHDQPKVINGCSDLLVDIFGDAGRHVRSAMGTSNLPMNQPVEIEMLLRVRPAEDK